MSKLSKIIIITFVLSLGVRLDTFASNPLIDQPGDNLSGFYSPSAHPNQQVASDWYMAGANPQRTSWVSEGVNPQASTNFGVKWYRPIEAYIGQHVQLITARDKVYVSTARGLVALNTANGDVVWRFDTELPLGHSPTVSGNLLYVGGFDKRVYALNADTGALVWKFEGAKAGFSTNPLVVEGKVMLGSRDGYFYALDQATGNLVWQYPASNAAPLGPILYSAAYKNGKVFFAANDNYAYALNTSNGSLAWKSAKMPGDGYQAFWPVVYGDYVVFSAALGYVMEGDPGTKSVADVIDQSDPYYAKMYNFQYGLDVVNTIQRDDVFHLGEADNSKLGPQFTSGGSGDTTGIPWNWGNNQTVVNAAKVTEYLEDDGQTRLNRSTNKPWRRGVIVLNTANGQEYTFDSDRDGHPEYAPFLFTGTKSGNRYPPLVIPMQNTTGGLNDVIYAQNFDEYRSGWGISRSRLTAWQLGTPYIHPVGAQFAIDEPFADSAGGQFLYSNLCCDRMGWWQNLTSGANGTFWDYNRTLESIKRDPSQLEYWMRSLAPGYDETWFESSMWDAYPRLWGNFGTTNGIYHNHGVQNPIIPYKGQLFVHRSNAIIALGPDAVSLRQRTTNETPEQYEVNISQEYPNVYRPLVTVKTPTQNLGPVLSAQDVRNKLDTEISKMLQTGHLRPGYYNGTRGHTEFSFYFENPGDTLLTLLQAYPLVSDNLKPNLEKYIRQHYKLYFENNLYVRTGYWLNNPQPYDLNNPDGVGQLQPREWMPVPPEVAQDMKNEKPDLGTRHYWSWSYPQYNIYAMWKYAQTFYSGNPTVLQDIYGKAKSKLQVQPPNNGTLSDYPWIHNGFIAGYIGFLNLQEMAGKSQADASLRTSVQTQLNNLLALRSNNFQKDQPWVGDKSADGRIYRRSFSVARNFIYMTPELAQHLSDNALSKVAAAINEYDRVAPYWVATRYEAAYGEYSSDNLYTHAAMFQAKAYILKEPEEQLLKYVDSPAFAVGDLSYIQTLVAVLSNPAYGYILDVIPATQTAETGGTAIYKIRVTPLGGFDDPITFQASTSSPTLQVDLQPAQITPPAQTQATLTLTDKNVSGSLTGALLYQVPLLASSSIPKKIMINFLVNPEKTFLPLVLNN